MSYLFGDIGIDCWLHWLSVNAIIALKDAALREAPSPMVRLDVRTDFDILH
jgi:hypothetical protein